MKRSQESQNVRNLPIIEPDNVSDPTIDGKNVHRSKRGRIRAAVLILVHLVILAHITHYFTTGRSVSPVEPSEAMYTLERGHVNAGAIFFALAILSTVIFGRFFCGWGCHIVALQDLCSYVLRRLGIRLKPLRSRLLVVIPFLVAFYMFCWPTVYRIWNQGRHPGFTDHLMTDNFWKTFPGPGIAVLTFVVCGGLVVYLLGNKGFCTYACPYGAFFSIADRLAIGRIRVTDACQHCGQCTAACTSNVFVSAEVKSYGMVVDPGCMKCMDCVSVCPNDALYFGLTEKKGFENPALARQEKIPPRRKSYDFSIAEELIGFVIVAIVVFAMRGLYDSVPFLLSVALGAISGYLVIQSWRFIRKRDLRIQNLRLKANSKTTRTGWLVIALGCIWFAFSVHSFLVQYYRYRGRHHLQQINLEWDDLFYTDVQADLTDEQKENIEGARSSFAITDGIGFVDVVEVKLGLASTNILQGNLEAGESYLRDAYRRNPPSTSAILRDFLATQNRMEEAIEIK